MECEAAEGYASGSFEFVNQDGTRGHFTMQTNPEEAAGAISRVVVEWWEATCTEGDEKWYGLVMTVDRDGGFDVAFSYDPPED